MRCASLLLFLLGGCRQIANPHDFPIVIDAALAAHNTDVGTVGDAIRHGMTYWIPVGAVIYENAEGGTFVTECTIASNADEVGRFEYVTGSICLNPGAASLGYWQIAPALAHELGHAMGLDHVPFDGESAIMNAHVANGLLRITQADYREFHRVWGD